ncbi:MAG: M20/M25/M40 family metallo-hydrolase [Anaerolineales bacterium]|jgi:acetylornithine deacetylase/succinyl-diaminopimelate desuccinylase-like protein
MSSSRQQSIDTFHRSRARLVEDIQDFISIPSISIGDGHKLDIQRAVRWVANRLNALQLDHVEVIETSCNPVVFGDLKAIEPDSPTVLIYGHYDVQPAEPLEHWKTDPFEGVVKDEYIYGRGACDMKGPFMACVAAVSALLDGGSSPVNVKFLVEGNEEAGPDVMGEFVPQYMDRLASDISLNCDGGMLGKNKPTIVYGLRGGSVCTIKISGPKADIHDGMYGGVVDNPIHVLSRLIAGFFDRQGRITLPGFYDKVRPLDAEERDELARLPRDDAYYLRHSGAPALWGDKNYLPVERVGVRPSLNVRLFQGGMRKNAIPVEANARIGMRLVPDQKPREAFEQLYQYIEQNVPPTVTWEVKYVVGFRPSLVDRHSTGIEALCRAFDSVWGVEPYYYRSGGGIPVVGHLQDIGIDSVLTGFLGDNIHGPNERIHLPTLEHGAEALIHFLYNL